MKKIAAVLLAGGQSRRMGTPKPLLEYKGAPLWRFQLEKLARLEPNELFLSAPAAFEFPDGPWTVVHDRSEHLGPLAGLEATLRLTQGELLVTLAVDMPAITSDFLALLLQKASPRGVVPHLDGFYHGACAVYPVSILPLVQRILSSNDRSFQHLVHEALRTGLIEIEEIHEERKWLFENWNSPQDLEGSRSAIA